MSNNTVPNALSAQTGLSDYETDKIKEKLWRLLYRQTEKYNGTDSTSVSEERLQCLARSMLYTVSAVSVTDGIPLKSLFENDPEAVLRRGQNILSNKRRMLKAKWNMISACIPKTENAYYMDTIENISLFFKNYEIYYGAHLIPCSIDYPLLCTVSEELLGIIYIERYIRALCMEGTFISRFEKSRAEELYQKTFDDYRETPANLCEPLLNSAIALAILEKDIKTLAVTENDAKRLSGVFCGKSEKQISDIIENAVLSVCEKLDIHGAEETEYFKAAARSLTPRIAVAVKNNKVRQ